MTLFAMLMLVVMTGCMMPPKTTVTKDGFMARMKTTEKHRAIIEDYDVYRTDCRWDQQMKDKDGEYYCPPPATKEAYDSHVYLAQHMESVLDTWGPEVLKAGAWVGSAGLMMHGLQTQAVSPGVQQGGNSISTFVACGSGKAFSQMQSAPGCR
jgi:hypothetical protein